MISFACLSFITDDEQNVNLNVGYIVSLPNAIVELKKRKVLGLPAGFIIIILGSCEKRHTGVEHAYFMVVP